MHFWRNNSWLFRNDYVSVHILLFVCKFSAKNATAIFYIRKVWSRVNFLVFLSKNKRKFKIRSEMEFPLGDRNIYYSLKVPRKQFSQEDLISMSKMVLDPVAIVLMRMTL